MAHTQGQLKAFVLFVKPRGMPKDWDRTDLWQSASAIPGVTVLNDDDGAEAMRFGAHVSGQVMVYDKEGKKIRFDKIKNNVKLFGRMLKAFYKGEYKHLSPKVFINTLIAILYFISGIDLIPDNIPVVGMLDDIAVIVWMIKTYAEEMEKYESEELLIK